MKRLLVAVWLLLYIAIPQHALAAGVRVSSEASLSSNETVTDNQYLVGGKVVAQGTMEQDVLLLGARADLPGTVKGDALIIAAESAVVSGTVLGDVRIFGGSVRITGTVEGDVVAVGGTVTIAPEASVKGELLLAGGQASIATSLQKHARIVAGAVEISGEVLSSANVTTERLVITSEAHVPGAIEYFAPREALVQSGSSVNGTITFNKVESFREHGLIERAVVSFLNFWIVLRFVTTLLLTFLLVYVFRVFSQKTTEYVLMAFGRSVLTGLLSLLLVPFIVAILFVSLILMPVSLLVVLGYTFVVILSSAVASIAIGALLKRAFSKKTQLEVSFKTASLGVVLLTVVQFVPFVGEATRFIFFLAALGAVLRYVYDHIRWREMSLFNK